VRQHLNEPNLTNYEGVDMAAAIASQLLDRSQALRDSVLALSVVVDLYMSSSMKNIDDMIFIVDHLMIPIDLMSDELVCLLREVSNGSA
jgi:hypothetical protein